MLSYRLLLFCYWLLFAATHTAQIMNKTAHFFSPFLRQYSFYSLRQVSILPLLSIRIDLCCYCCSLLACVLKKTFVWVNRWSSLFLIEKMMVPISAMQYNSNWCKHWKNNNDTIYTDICVHWTKFNGLVLLSWIGYLLVFLGRFCLLSRSGLTVFDFYTSISRNWLA